MSTCRDLEVVEIFEGPRDDEEARRGVQALGALGRFDLQE